MADGYEPVCTVWACIDCTLMHANGETGELPDGCVPLSEVRDDEQVTMGLTEEEHHEDCTEWDRSEGNCDCDRISFTWQSCELCTCRLGGERQAFTLWRKKAEVHSGQ